MLARWAQPARPPEGGEKGGKPGGVPGRVSGTPERAVFGAAIRVLWAAATDRNGESSAAFGLGVARTSSSGTPPRKPRKPDTGLPRPA
jgi:hypothetical protein